LIAQLYQQFSSNRGYALYPDVPTFFNLSNSQTPAGKWEKIIIGVITNSDNRVPSVLESLGLSVGPRRAGTQAQQQIETKEDHDIDFVVLSYDVEAAKPDRKIFDAGVDMLREVLTAEAEKREALAAEIEEEKLKYVEKESERLNEYIRDNDVEKAAKHLESLIRMSRTPPLEPRLSVDDFEKLYVGDEIEKDYLGAERAGWNALYLKRPERADGGLFEPQSDGIEEMDKRVRDENGNVVTKKIRFITHLEQLQHWHP
jgi:FMN phosphatase YigB (HAD superfamily)